jgi:hypothetical protein
VLCTNEARLFSSFRFNRCHRTFQPTRAASRFDAERDGGYDLSVEEKPRFVVDSAEALVEAAQHADPPVRAGDLAELRLPTRSVLLRSSLEREMIVWRELDAAEPPRRSPVR